MRANARAGGCGGAAPAAVSGGLAWLACLATLAGCASRPIALEHPDIRAEVFRTADPGKPVLPERVVSTGRTRELFERTRDNGICFSGGGTRALSVAAGSLRALTDLGYMDTTRYLSCVSGGSWACATYTYFLGDEDAFLGKSVTPLERETWPFSSPRGEPSWQRSIPKTTLLHTATKGLEDPLAEALEHGPAGEAWQTAIGETYFKPFGLYTPDAPRFFTLGQESAQRILDENRARDLQPEWRLDDFITARPDRPYLIVNATILWPTSLFRGLNRVNIEYTPLGAGNACFVELESRCLFGTERQATGGGFVAPFAFGSSGPALPPVFRPDGAAVVGMPASRDRFTIWKASGMSSAAYAADVARVDRKLLPEVEYWAVGAAGAAPTRRIRIGDGGNLDNLGIMPLLQRQVKRIVVFNSAQQTLEGAVSAGTGGDLAPLFGYPTKARPHNTVFARADYEVLLRALLAEKALGRLPMVKLRMQVLANDFYCIEPYEPEILWIYNDLSLDWAEQLRPDVQWRVLEGAICGEGRLAHFPNYRTVADNGLHLVKLTPQQVALLADLYDWSLRRPRARELLREMLGPRIEPLPDTPVDP